MSRKTTTKYRLHVTCPNCGSMSTGKNKRVLSALVSELAYQCSNTGCNAQFVVQVAAIRYLQMPAQINLQAPALPLSTQVKRKALVQALESAHQEGDDAELLPPLSPQRDMLEFFFTDDPQQATAPPAPSGP